MNDREKILAFFALLCLLVFCGAMTPTDAAEPETEGPMLCAFTKSTICDNEDCTSVDLESIGLPAFFRVDLRNKMITGVEPMGGGTAGRRTPVRTSQLLGDNLILQGIELRAWSMLISRKTGKMTLTASDDEEAGVLFGVCTNM